MEWAILFGCIVGAWAMLRMLGGERQRRIEDLHEKSRIAAEIAREQAAQLPTLSGVKSK